MIPFELVGPLRILLRDIAVGVEDLLVDGEVTSTGFMEGGTYRGTVLGEGMDEESEMTVHV